MTKKYSNPTRVSTQHVPQEFCQMCQVPRDVRLLLPVLSTSWRMIVVTRTTVRVLLLPSLKTVQVAHT